MSRLLNRLSGRMFGWFDFKDPSGAANPLPKGFGPFARLALMTLEDRVVPAVFNVTSLADSGANTLRQAILDATASAGSDTININVSGNIALASALPTLAKGGTADGLIIDATVAGVTVTGGGTAGIFNTSIGNAGTLFTLSDFTITGGSTTATGSGAALTMTTQNVALSNLVIRNCTATADTTAGAAYLTTGTLTVNSGTVIGGSLAAKNQATGFNTGGGIMMNGQGTVNINNASISFNSSSRRGGGINCFGGTINIAGGTLSGNASGTLGGGGVAMDVGLISVTAGSVLSGNLTSGSGGAILMSGGGSLVVADSTIGPATVVNPEDRNRSLSGGGIFTGNGATVTIANSTIQNNSSTDTGGGARFGLINFPVVIINSTIRNNIASDGAGGIGMTSGTLTLTSSTISGNTSNAPTFGSGGIYFSSGPSTVNISHTTISGNSSSASDSGGGGLCLYNTSTTSTISNSTIANNTATKGAAIAGYKFHGTLNVFNSTIAHNSATVGTTSGAAYFLNSNGSGTLNLDSTLVADNLSSGVPHNFSGKTTANFSAWDDATGRPAARATCPTLLMAAESSENDRRVTDS